MFYRAILRLELRAQLAQPVHRVQAAAVVAAAAVRKGIVRTK